MNRDRAPKEKDCQKLDGDIRTLTCVSRTYKSSFTTIFSATYSIFYQAALTALIICLASDCARFCSVVLGFWEVIKCELEGKDSHWFRQHWKSVKLAPRLMELKLLSISNHISGLGVYLQPLILVSSHLEGP